MKIKQLDIKYSLNPGVIENLEQLFSEENRKIAERYKEIEELAIGIIYTYGVVDFENLRNIISTYMNEIISEQELKEIFFKRLNLNLFINYHKITWTDIKKTEEFITYLDEEEIDINKIIIERLRRNINFKKYSKKEILERKEYNWDKRAQDLYDFIKSKNNIMWEMRFEKILKENELGENILEQLVQNIIFEDKEEIDEYIKLYMNWYDNSPQYILGGYSPNEVSKRIY